MTFQFLMVVQSFLLGQDSTAFCGVENPVFRSGGLQGSRPRQASGASSAHLPSAADDAFTEFFRTCPQIF